MKKGGEPGSIGFPAFLFNLKHQLSLDALKFYCPFRAIL